METSLHHNPPDNQKSDSPQQQHQQRHQSPATSRSHSQQYSYQDHYLLKPSPYDANANANAADSSDQQNPPGRFTEEWDASQRGSSIVDGHGAQHLANMQRAASVTSYAAGDDSTLPVRNNTLRKKTSMRRTTGSIRRSSSRRSTRAGSVKSLVLQSASDPDEERSAFFCPVPTSGAPTEVLAERFLTWRKVLKDLISYFREIQNHYESRSKALVKLGNAANNISTPSSFLKSAGIDDALQLLRDYNKQAVQEANKAREIEEDVILALTGLRSDLQQKIKEIKHLSGDFKNSVDKEMDNTGKAVAALADILDKSEIDEAATTGKQDPFLLRLAVDRQVERQIDEENYLHQAYLNLEGSGRELESIVVGEIQKAYNAYAGILKREAENNLNIVGDLREGPISMPKDQEWIHFVTHEDRVVDPTMPLRTPEQIHYPGQDHLSAQEIRAGLLERKSKYLKSYTAGWYVLSSTHLHEFKSADKGPVPVMSLYLPDQKVGSHSEEGSSSNKFILKGRQTGGMHRGHTWVFRAESRDTMLAWYEDIKALTEKSPEERTQFVRTHSRSLSRSSRRSARSGSSDGLDDDDEEPFSGNEVVTNPATSQSDVTPRRPQPGGRFPSDLQVNAQRGLQAPQSPSSVSSGNQGYPSDTQVAAAAAGGGVAGAAAGSHLHNQQQQYSDTDAYNNTNNAGYGRSTYVPMGEMSSQAAIANQEAQYDGVNPYTSEPVQQQHQYHYQGGEHSGESNLVAPVLVTKSNKATLPETNDKSGDDAHADAHEQTGQEPVHQSTAVAAVLGSTNSSIPSEPRATDSSEAINGENYTNTASEVHGDSIGATAVDPITAGASNVPRSEALADNKILQAVPESEAADHITPAATPLGETLPPRSNRPDDHRTDSMTTISNLDIPGRFPKASAVSGADINAAAAAQ